MTASKELPGKIRISRLMAIEHNAEWYCKLAEEYPELVTEYIHADLVQKLVEALEKISTTKFLSYEHSPAPPYGTGVTDGHRLAAEWAREALARFRGEIK